MTILELMLQVLISSGIIWAATMAFKRIFRGRMSPQAHVVIWGVLIARLVLPVTFDTGIHFIQLPPAAETAAQTEAASGPLSAYSAGRGTPAHAASVETAPQAAESSNPGGLRPEQNMAAQESARGAADRSSRSTIRWTAGPAEIIPAVWVIGMLVFAAVAVHAYSELRRDVEARTCSGADPLHLLFQECMSELGIRKRVFLAVQSELAGPALMFPNIVLLHEEMLHMDPDAVRMALRHELTHFVRRDHIWAVALCILRIVWWFNPFVWLAVREIREDLETACDSDVVRRLGKGGRSEYARTVLAMFGRTETNQAVLGMAFGGAKRNAERRIRGIYMKPKSRRSAKAGALVLAAVLSLTCFTTACQPTPAAEAVVNQKEGVPSDALLGEGYAVDPQASAEPAASYSSAEHWSETIDKADNFIVTADIDVLMPDVDAYPVEKLAPRELTQELVDQLIEYFAPGAEFYRTSRVLTKSDWEERILEMREALAADQANGDEDAVRSDEEVLEGWTEMYENAPETSERAPATTEFTYAIDELSGQPYTELGPNIIEISTETADGVLKQFDVRRRIEDDPAQYPYFSYISASYQTQSTDASAIESLASSRSGIEQLPEPDRSQELEALEEMQEELDRRSALYARNPMDPAAAKQQALDALGALGIPSVQIVSVEPALIGPYTAAAADTQYQDGSTPGLSEPAMYLEFRRENGGIPCIQPDQITGQTDSQQTQYSAPFIPENGSMIIGEDGTIRCFTWTSPTQAVEIVAPDSELIPLDEAKTRLIDDLYRTELGMSQDYLDSHSMHYDIEELKLVMGYADIPNDPDSALAIPAWYMKAKGSSVSDDSGKPDAYTLMECMISALDGAPVLMAGSL